MVWLLPVIWRRVVRRGDSVEPQAVVNTEADGSSYLRDRRPRNGAQREANILQLYYDLDHLLKVEHKRVMIINDRHSL